MGQFSNFKISNESRNEIHSESQKEVQPNGFTIIEVVIAVAILSAVVFGATAAITSLFKTQATVADRDEASEFAASLSRFLNADSSCSAALSNTPFPTSINVGDESQTGQSLMLRGYTGFGGEKTSGAPLQAGTEIGRRLRIRTLDLKNKSIPPQQVMFDRATYDRFVGQIRLQLEQLGDGPRDDASSWRPLPPRFFEFPILVSQSGMIHRCQVEMQVDDACQVIGSQFDPESGTCTPVTQCQIKGAFARSTCQPEYQGCAVGSVNPLTGDLSCPEGAVANQSGQSQSSFTVSCGKKCTQDVTQTTEFFVCMQCQ